MVSAAVLGALLLYCRPGEVSDALASFDWRLGPLVLCLVIADHAVRFWRWRLLFRAATGRALPLGEDAALFLAGTAMIVTPARAGEWLKSFYAQKRHGIAAARTAPIPLIERFADVASMALLASIGATTF